MLNVFVQQLNFVALFTEFDAQEITNRKHSYPSVPINNRQVPATNQLHSFQSLVRCLVTLDHGAQIARDLTDTDREWIFTGHQDAFQNITLGKDAEQFAAIIEHADRANVALSHKLRHLLD